MLFSNSSKLFGIYGGTNLLASGVGEGVGVGVTTGVGVGVGVGVNVGIGFAIATPLFHTSFLPLFTHVYFLPAEVEVAPSFEHVAPAFTAALAADVISVNDTRSVRNFILVLKMFSQFEWCRYHQCSIGKSLFLHK